MRSAADQREQAIDQLLELGGAVDGLPGKQIELDIDALRTATGRTFTEAERDEIRTHQQRAHRWTFLVSGLRHPNFVHRRSGHDDRRRQDRNRRASAVSLI